MDAPDQALEQPLVDNARDDDAPRVPLGSANGCHDMYNPLVDAGDEEEKQETPGRSQVDHPHVQKQLPPHKMPYAAPSVHPYAVPQYDPRGGYSGSAGNGWGGGQSEESRGDQGVLVDIVFSGMYTLAAVFTIVQGFGMLLHFTFASGEHFVAWMGWQCVGSFLHVLLMYLWSDDCL